MALVAFKVAGSTLLLNYGVQLGSSFAYSRLCMPQSVIDLATSFVATASPVCSFLLSTMQVTQSNFAVVLTTSLAAIAAGMLKPV